MTETRTVPSEPLHDYTTRLLQRAGFTLSDASGIAEALVDADLRGIASHGTVHVPNIVKRTALGLLNPHPNVRVLSDAPGCGRLDADRGSGHVVAARAMDLAVEKARACGIGAVSVTNSTHFGIGARYAERAAHAGMLGLALSNATATMATAGGAEALIGTNPIAFAVPGTEGIAMCLDMGMGQVTLNAVRDAARTGRPLPPGVATDRDGSPTTQASKMLDGGFLLPFGGHKGFGLALLVEVFAGVLAGAGIGAEVGSLYVDYDRPQNTGHFLLAIDPARFLPREEFDSRRDTLVAMVKRSRRAAGTDPAMLPGEREYGTRRQRLRTGIPLAPETAAALAHLGPELGVPVPESLQAD